MSADLLSETKDLYSLFSLTEKATPAEIKRAYYKLALQYHPDKQLSSTTEEREEKTKKFQALGFAYSILSDPKKREKYDRTGETADLPGIEDLGKDGWDTFFKELWSGIVNAKSIEEFKNKYQGTEEERKDLIEAYNNFKGDMDKIMASVPGSSADDEPRFCEVLKEAIKSKEIRSYKKFIETSNTLSMDRRKKEAEREAKEAAKMAEKVGLDNKLLGSNEEAKYGGNESKKAKTTGKGRKNKKMIEEPTEEEFQAIQEKIKAKNNKT
ncbi:DnaJ-domain-containing protein [Rhizophagus clarus]|uniref:DnaJ-domain-containing protein n=1 Tax=Rhizophagus clarus TaxID=94130 RepID=A0A8H3R1M8_9GLOM|nr:DnaJ-domain-containing protein [Rhizophagus clarus]